MAIFYVIGFLSVFYVIYPFTYIIYILYNTYNVSCPKINTHFMMVRNVHITSRYISGYGDNIHAGISSRYEPSGGEGGTNAYCF